MGRDRLPVSLIGLEHGNFIFTRMIGAGGMGTVYLAEHRWIARKKAVKVLNEEHAQFDSLVRRFFDEATAASACQHEHIVNIEDCGYLRTEDGVELPFIDMEYLEGIDVLQACRPTGRFEDIDRAVKIIGYAADALAAAHERGIVHRDLKPENVFLSRRGTRSDFVKLLDFGIARLTGDLAPGTRTRTGAVIGTPEYMSPEQANGHHPDGRSDVWGLGVLLYRMLAGRVPFADETFSLLAVKINHETPTDIRVLRPEVPEGVVRAVREAMRKQVQDRPTMVEFKDLLLTGDAAPRSIVPELSISAPSSLRHHESSRVAGAPTLIFATTPSERVPSPTPPSPPPREPDAPIEHSPSSKTSPTSTQRPRGRR
jgi:serine/threonine-protein kinase